MLNKIWNAILDFFRGPAKTAANAALDPVKEEICDAIDAAVDEAVDRGEESADAVRSLILSRIRLSANYRALPLLVRSLIEQTVLTYDLSPVVGPLTSKLRIGAAALKARIRGARF